MAILVPAKSLVSCSPRRQPQQPPPDQQPPAPPAGNPAAAPDIAPAADEAILVEHINQPYDVGGCTRHCIKAAQAQKLWPRVGREGKITRPSSNPPP
eukprot:scaffold159893_cov40-Cyclotella_meneghiniana.AAC.1